MKSTISKYYTLFFSFCMLASLSVSIYQNIKTPVLKTNFKVSKHFSLMANEQHAAYNDILFEENKNKTFNDYKIWKNLTPYIFSHFQSEITLFPPSLHTFRPLAEKQTYSIYIAVCNFRV
jgi:hypothetical protein